MKGLELSQRFFEAHGLPLLHQEFGDYVDRMAVGLVGDGSDCFGFDDHLSQDHDWGPGFCVWLVTSDYDAISRPLQEAIDRLPKTFAGYGPRMVSQGGEGRVGVFEMRSFYQGFIGLDHLPSDLNEWLLIPENSLAACTNGKVFWDPLGEFSKWRAELSTFYPDDVRLKKIASRCMTIGQSGQYNFPRCVKRGEYFGARYAETKCCADVISLVFLLNRKYTPFYKWMHRAVKDLPILGNYVHEQIAGIVNEWDCSKKESLIEAVCGVLIQGLRAQGMTDSESSYLPDHGPVIKSRIQDENLRGRNVWVG